MASFLDVCRFNPTAGSTTDWTVSSAVTGYQTPALAGAVNGATYRYRAESADLSQWEVGTGVYTVSGTVLSRGTVLYNSSGTGTGAGQSGAGTKISFSAAPQIAIVALAEDCGPLALTNAALASGPLSPTAISQTTPALMAGMGGTFKITPVYSTRLLVLFNGSFANNTSNNQVWSQAMFGTGTAPSNGAALTGTAFGGVSNGFINTGTATLPLSNGGIITGLTVGTAYWFDQAAKTVTGGSITLQGIVASIMEF